MKNLILFLGDNYESMHKKPLAAVHVYDKYHSRTIRLEFYLQDCTVSEVADGYDFLINCAPQGISFRIEMRSAPDKLSFKIPYDTILEAQNYCWLLEGVEIMPEFGAQPYGVEGYLLWPNYSGVACKFNKTKSIEFRDIIYSADNRWENFTSMPIFGVVEKDKSFLCIITDGQFECELIHRLAIGVERLHSTTHCSAFGWIHGRKLSE